MPNTEIRCGNCGARYVLQKHTKAATLQCKKCGAKIAVPPPQAEAQPAQPAAQLAGYQNLHVLSENDRHTVYRAEQTAMKRTVAVKVLKKPDGDAASFLKNARLMANMRHASIVSIFDVNAEGLPYFSMEYVEGSTVREMLDSAGLPPVADAIRIAVSAGSAFSHAMRKGTHAISADADSVMLTSTGEIKLLPSAFSQTGSSPGTPEIQAIRGLGVLLYTLLTGKEPRLSSKRLMPPSSYNKDVTPELDKVTLQLLQGGKKGFASIVTATQAIKHLAASKASSSRHSSEFRQHLEKRKSANNKTKVLATIAAIVVVVGVVGAMFFFLRRQQDISTRLDRINLSVTSKDYNSVIDEGEAFLAAYPSNKRAGQIEAQVADAKNELQRIEHRQELIKAVDEVFRTAQKDPQYVLKYEKQLDEIKEQFANFDGVERDYILPQKKAVRNLWQDKQEAQKNLIMSFVRKSQIGKAHDQLQEFTELCKQEGVPEDSARAIPEFRQKVLDAVNNLYIAVGNKAFTFQQQGETAKAEALYQTIIDTWGFDYFVEQAKKALSRLRDVTPAEPGETKTVSRREQWRNAVDKATQLSHDGKFDEAIQLYQNIVDTWNEEQYKTLAQDNIKSLEALQKAKEQKEVTDGN